MNECKYAYRIKERQTSLVRRTLQQVWGQLLSEEVWWIKFGQYEVRQWLSATPLTAWVEDKCKDITSDHSEWEQVPTLLNKFAFHSFCHQCYDLWTIRKLTACTRVRYWASITVKVWQSSNWVSSSSWCSGSETLIMPIARYCLRSSGSGVKNIKILSEKLRNTIV